MLNMLAATPLIVKMVCDFISFNLMYLLTLKMATSYKKALLLAFGHSNMPYYGYISQVLIAYLITKRLLAIAEPHILAITI